jgi:hypothetical protein
MIRVRYKKLPPNPNPHAITVSDIIFFRTSLSLGILLIRNATNITVMDTSAKRQVKKANCVNLPIDGYCTPAGAFGLISFP